MQLLREPYVYTCSWLASCVVRYPESVAQVTTGVTWRNRDALYSAELRPENYKRNLDCSAV